MSKICLCLTAKTLAANLEILDKNRKYVDLVELRADYLDPDERFLIRRFPEMAGVPVILAIRRTIDGGSYAGGEGSRITLLAKGLAHAEADRRRNFAFVDLEEDLNVPSLEEAARAFGTRIIRSWHSLEDAGEDLAGKLRSLRRVGDEIVKLRLMPRSLDELLKVYQAAKETRDMDKILVCTGKYCVNTGILAELLGSQMSYTFPAGEEDCYGAEPGVPSPKELVELYRFHEITNKTRVFAVMGYPLNDNDYPRFFNTIFGIEQADAVFVPVPADSVNSLMSLAEEIDISGISIASPYKEKVLSFLAKVSKDVDTIGACNTLVASPQGWIGHNTDAAAFSGSLLDFIGRRDFRRRRLTVVGAGGYARAVAAEVYRLKGKALILDSNVSQARALAGLYNFAYAGLDSRGADMMESFSDIIVQTSQAEAERYVEADPIEFYKFSGREVVMDIVHKPEKTRCLMRAQEAGCRVLNGYDMLLRQARSQYSLYMNREFPPSLISRVAF